MTHNYFNFVNLYFFLIFLSKTLQYTNQNQLLKPIYCKYETEGSFKNFKFYNNKDYKIYFVNSNAISGGGG